LSNLRIPLGSSNIEKALRGTNPHFDRYGLAIDEIGKRLAIEQYQIAINKVIDWLGENEIPISKVVIFGSFACFDNELPGLGVHNLNSSLLELESSLSIPSDIDIVVRISWQRAGILIKDFETVHNEILDKNGIDVHLAEPSFLEVLSKYNRKTTPIAKFFGNGLINAYQASLTSKSATNELNSVKKPDDI